MTGDELSPPSTKERNQKPRHQIRRRRPFMLAIVVGVGLLAILAGTLLPLWFLGYLPPRVFLSGCWPGPSGDVQANVSADFANGSSSPVYVDVIGSWIRLSRPVPPPCYTSLQEPAGGHFTDGFVAENLDNASSHEIVAVSVSPPWSLVSLNATLPVDLGRWYNLSASEFECAITLAYPNDPGAHFSASSVRVAVEVD